MDLNVGNREVGARRVGDSAEFASDDHALHGPRGVPMCAGDLDRRALAPALKGVLVEENGTVVLSDHVEVLRQRTIGDKACPFLHTNHMPRAPCGPGFQEKKL